MVKRNELIQTQEEFSRLVATFPLSSVCANLKISCFIKITSDSWWDVCHWEEVLSRDRLLWWRHDQMGRRKCRLGFPGERTEGGIAENLCFLPHASSIKSHRFWGKIPWFNVQFLGWNLRMLNTGVLLQVWLCGGQVVNVPCSHAAHFESATSRSYRDSWTPDIHRNYQRVAEVWLGPYKKYFYQNYPQLQVRVLNACKCLPDKNSPKWTITLKICCMTKQKTKNKTKDLHCMVT